METPSVKADAETSTTSAQAPGSSANRSMPPKKRRLARKPPNLWLQIPRTPTMAPTSTPSPFLLSTPDMECLAPLENRTLTTPRTADVVESLIRFEADNFLKCSSDLFSLDPTSRPLAASSDSKKRISIELNVAGRKVVVPVEVEVLNGSSDANAPVELSSIGPKVLEANSPEPETSAAVPACSPSPGKDGKPAQRYREASKRIRTREQNKIAAKSYRARKKETFQLLIKENQQLQKEKTELMRRVKQLESEVIGLRQRLGEGVTTLATKTLTPIVSTSTSAANVLLSVGSAVSRNTNGTRSTIIPVVHSGVPMTQDSVTLGQMPKNAVFILPKAPPPSGESVLTQPVVTPVNKLV